MLQIVPRGTIGSGQWAVGSGQRADECSARNKWLVAGYWLLVARGYMAADLPSPCSRPEYQEGEIEDCSARNTGPSPLRTAHRPLPTARCELFCAEQWELGWGFGVGGVRCRRGGVSDWWTNESRVFLLWMRETRLLRIFQCPGQDLNLHDVTRCHLKAVRLPIPPPGLRGRHYRCIPAGGARLWGQRIF